MDDVIVKRFIVKSYNKSQLTFKRIIDIIIAGVGLILLAPVIGLIALAVRLDSPGPVIYRHRRIGKNGQPFDLIKFRSMAFGGDDRAYTRYLHDLIESSRNGKGMPYWKMETDPRITRIGRFLRQYYLDELPQLWNILIGDMSLVGPRPHVQLEVDHYTTEQRRRLSVKPGATGLWQVQGKADCTFRELLELDLDYVDHWSLGMDFQLMFRTLAIMLKGGEGSWARMAKVVPGQRGSPSQPESSLEPSVHLTPDH
jgi:lipopolysaccharide/colanic/teichoic acid biosynthesis glycosyltransferase